MKTLKTAINKISKKPYVLEISAKCSDLFSAQLKTNQGLVISEYSGYVPSFFPDEHYGDYVMLSIDINTGRILNWKKPSESQLNQLKQKRGA